MNFKKASSYVLSLLVCFNISAFCTNATGKITKINNNKSQKISTNVSKKKKISKKLIKVPYINQKDIVYGCEAVSSTMLMKYYGYNINEKDFTDKYLIKKNWYISNGKVYGPDPDAAFPGNPYISGGLNCGFGCYAPSTAKSMNKILKKSRHRALWEKGLSLNQIVNKYIKKNIPVLIWATMDMKESKKTMKWIINYTDENSTLKNGDEFTWISGEHCLVLVGYDSKYYYFNDPYKNHGLISYEKSLVEKRYEEMGKQCVHIRTLKKTTAKTKK